MKKIPEEYRKFIYFCSVAVVAVFLFCIVFVITYNKQVEKTEAKTTIGAPSTQYTTTESTTTEAETEEVETETTTIPHVTMDGNNATTTAEYSTPSWVIESQSAVSESAAVSEAAKNLPSGNKEIVSAYVAAVNKLKATESFTLVKQNALNLTIDSVTGGSMVEKIVQDMLDKNSSSEPRTLKFVNGVDSTSGTTVDKEIPPISTSCTLKESQIESASAKLIGTDGSYSITITLGKDTQTLDTAAPIYSSCMEVMDVDSLDLSSSMKIESMDIIYNGGKIVANINADGRIVSMTHSMTIEKGSGSGKVSVIPGKLEMHGTNSQSYQISY